MSCGAPGTVHRPSATAASGPGAAGAGRKIGVFGGTFDPVHVGHLIAAEEARASLSLDEVVFVPAGRPWFKEGRPLTGAGHRLAMVELAVAGHAHFRVWDVEVRRPGPSYTVDTLEELRTELGEAAELYLIVGTDVLSELSRWQRPERVVEMATIVGMRRAGAEELGPEQMEAPSRPLIVDGPRIEVSGADLRRRVAEGRPIRYMVPEAVERYIREHRLYRDYGRKPPSQSSPAEPGKEGRRMEAS